MAHKLQRYFAALFFAFGSIMLVLLVFVRYGLFPTVTLLLIHSFDLPLLGSGMLYAGTSLYASLTASGSSSRLLAFFIGIPLLVLFLCFIFFNFAFPFAS